MERSIFHIKKKDIVQVMSGSEKGKTGKVLRIANKRGVAFVEKLNLLKRHKKAAGTTPGGIIESEGPIYASKLLLFCDKCSRGVRTFRTVVDGGKKIRSCRKCKTQLDK